MLEPVAGQTITVKVKGRLPGSVVRSYYTYHAHFKTKWQP